MSVKKLRGENGFGHFWPNPCKMKKRRLKFLFFCFLRMDEINVERGEKNQCEHLHKLWLFK